MAGWTTAAGSAAESRPCRSAACSPGSASCTRPSHPSRTRCPATTPGTPTTSGPSWWSRSATATEPRRGVCASPAPGGGAQPSHRPRPTMPDRVWVQVEDREIELSNLDKVLYPVAGFTKGEVIDYYVRVAEVILPHLRGRPMTRIRYPDGVHRHMFFEKNA